MPSRPSSMSVSSSERIGAGPPGPLRRRSGRRRRCPALYGSVQEDVALFDVAQAVAVAVAGQHASSDHERVDGLTRRRCPERPDRCRPRRRPGQSGGAVRVSRVVVERVGRRRTRCRQSGSKTVGTVSVGRPAVFAEPSVQAWSPSVSALTLSGSVRWVLTSSSESGTKTSRRRCRCPRAGTGPEDALGRRRSGRRRRCRRQFMSSDHVVPETLGRSPRRPFVVRVVLVERIRSAVVRIAGRAGPVGRGRVAVGDPGRRVRGIESDGRCPSKNTSLPSCPRRPSSVSTLSSGSVP